MPQNFYSKLENILKQDSRFVDQEGDLLKSNVIDAAYKADKKLVELLLSGKKFKTKFFSKVKDVLVFNINDFVAYIQDKNFLADSYTKYRNKIGLNIYGKFLNERKEVALVWPFKDCVLEGGMTKEDEKRKEIFFNEILAQDEIDKLLTPKVLTNWKRYSQKSEEKVKDLKRDDSGTIRENLIIKGNNLLTLYSLKQQFQNKIKLIYIDPPYNTGGDNNIFTYNNNFNHSTWLTFMKNRLEVARDLLKEDGVLAITIDDYEQAHLKILGDEVFGRNNYIGTIIIQNNPRGRTINSHFAICHEYCHFYAKSIGNVEVGNFDLTKEQKDAFNLEDNAGKYRLLPFRRSGGYSTPEERPNSYYPIYYDKDKRFSLEKKSGWIEIFPIDSSGKKRVWRQTRPSFLEDVKRGDVICKQSQDKYTIYLKDRIKEGRKPKTIWADSKYDASSYGTILLKEMFGGDKIFSYPKSIHAVKDTIKLFTKSDDIVLDFFAGSGTTGQAVLDLNIEDNKNRKFILVEQLNDHIKVCKERIQKVIQNLAKDKNLFSGKEESDFIYCELMKYNELFVDRIKKASSSAKATADKKDTKELLKIWEEMKAKSFLNYNIDIKKFDETIDEFKKLPFAKQQRTLFDLLNKNQLYVSLSEIKDKEFKVGEEDKKMNMKFYGN